MMRSGSTSLIFLAASSTRMRPVLWSTGRSKRSIPLSPTAPNSAWLMWPPAWVGTPMTLPPGLP